MSRHRTPEQLKYHREYERNRRLRWTTEQHLVEPERKSKRYQATKHLRVKVEKVLKYSKGPVPTFDAETTAYLAGLFDGEACIRIGLHEEGRVRCTAEVKIAMTHKPTMEWLSGVLDKPFCAHKSKNTNARIAWSIRVSNVEGVISLLEQLLPFLKVKREVAESVLEFCYLRKPKINLSNDQRFYTDEELALYSKVRRLNRVGTKGE